MAKEKRTVFRLRFKPRGGGHLGGWYISRGGEADGYQPRKSDAVKLASERARTFASGGALAQLVIHRRDGRIQSERTYGRDPRRSKG